MEAGIQDLIKRYRLTPHTEGGHYRELYRSAEKVQLADGRIRSAITAIHFLLGSGDISRWHRVESDELWHFCEGSPLELHEISRDLSDYTVHALDPREGSYFAVIPAGRWQAARSTGGYTLVSCMVGPGFDFSDFRLLADASGIRRDLLRRFPKAIHFC
jgi:predicted cupin superfamily sugar epimerase